MARMTTDQIMADLARAVHAAYPDARGDEILARSERALRLLARIEGIRCEFELSRMAMENATIDMRQMATRDAYEHLSRRLLGAPPRAGFVELPAASPPIFDVKVRETLQGTTRETASLSDRLFLDFSLAERR